MNIKQGYSKDKRSSTKSLPTSKAKASGYDANFALGRQDCDVSMRKGGPDASRKQKQVIVGTRSRTRSV